MAAMMTANSGIVLLWPRIAWLPAERRYRLGKQVRQHADAVRQFQPTGLHACIALASAFWIEPLELTQSASYA